MDARQHQKTIAIALPHATQERTPSQKDATERFVGGLRVMARVGRRQVEW